MCLRVLTESASSSCWFNAHKFCSDRALSVDRLTSVSADHQSRRSTEGLIPSDVIVSSRNSRGTPRRCRPPQTVMDDVDNDDGYGRTGNEDTRGNDSNNNEDDDDDIIGSTTNNTLKMTSEEATSLRCKPVSSAVTQLSSTVSSIKCKKTVVL